MTSEQPGDLPETAPAEADAESADGRATPPPAKAPRSSSASSGAKRAPARKPAAGAAAKAATPRSAAPKAATPGEEGTGGTAAPKKAATPRKRPASSSSGSRSAGSKAAAARTSTTTSSRSTAAKTGDPVDSAEPSQQLAGAASSDVARNADAANEAEQAAAPARPPRKRPQRAPAAPAVGATVPVPPPPGAKKRAATPPAGAQKRAAAGPPPPPPTAVPVLPAAAVPPVPDAAAAPAAQPGSPVEFTLTRPPRSASTPTVTDGVGASPAAGEPPVAAPAAVEPPAAVDRPSAPDAADAPPASIAEPEDSSAETSAPDPAAAPASPGGRIWRKLLQSVTPPQRTATTAVDVTPAPAPAPAPAPLSAEAPVADEVSVPEPDSAGVATATSVTALVEPAPVPESMVGQPVLSIRGLTKRYDSTLAVDGLDLDVHPGSFFGLVGPNGAGKTTTLSMIAGLLRPSEGTVTVHGADVWHDPLTAKRQMGVLPDRLRLFDRLTGAQLLHYSGVLRGLDAATVRARTADLARSFGLEDALGRLVIDYSAGMTKKIALAAAMLHSPRLLILDEPFESVDPVSAANIIEILQRYVAAGGTVVLSSHSMDLVQRICDSVAILGEGRVLDKGTMAEVRGEQTLEQRFVELAGGRISAEGMEWLHTFSD